MALVKYGSLKKGGSRPFGQNSNRNKFASIMSSLSEKAVFRTSQGLLKRGHMVGGHSPRVIFFPHGPKIFVWLKDALKHIFCSLLTPYVTCFQSFLTE